MNTVETIWEEWGTGLRQFILKRVSDETIADDILQEVFVKIQSRIETLRDVSKFRSWLYQITRNTIIDHYRSKKPMIELPETLSLKDESVADDIIEDLTLCVNNMVDRLPDKYRQAVILTTYHGMTQKKMGEKLQISLPGAKSRVQRAREKLKGMLLECCHFELDRLGKVINYEPKRPSHYKCGCQAITPFKPL